MNPPAGVDKLFISERRKPLSRVRVWHMIGEIAKAAGVAHLDIHPHMLRNSCGYALVNKGTDIRIISGYLGHRAISSTVRFPLFKCKVPFRKSAWASADFQAAVRAYTREIWPRAVRSNVCE
jgi:hypothetical protein